MLSDEGASFIKNNDKDVFMEYFKWTDQLSLYVEEIDTQHKRLVSLVNEIFLVMNKGEGKDSVGQILDELTEYVIIHFATEERWMKTHNYPGLKGHKKEHEDLKKRVNEFNREYYKGELYLATKLAIFLKDWLTSHIQQTDKKFGYFINKKNNKIPNVVN